jgi:hypothetical protein
MKIKGLEGLSDEQIKIEMERGGKFIIFQYCISIIVMTYRRPSSIYFIKKNDGTFGKSLPFTLISFLLGWWGIPWGPIHTIGAITNNLKGGRDVTAEVLQSFSLNREEQAQ